MRHLLFALILLSPLFSSGQQNTSNSRSNSNIRVRISDSVPNISKIAVIGKESELCNGTLDDGQGLAEVVEGELLGIYGVVERNHLEDVLDEQRLAMGGLLLRDSDFAKAGCLAGAQGTVLVSYGCLQGKTKIQVKLVDCSTSDMYWSATGFDVSEFELLDELRLRLLDEGTAISNENQVAVAEEKAEAEEKEEEEEEGDGDGLNMAPKRDSVPLSTVVKPIGKERKKAMCLSYIIGAGDIYPRTMRGRRGAERGVSLGYRIKLNKERIFYTEHSLSHCPYNSVFWDNYNAQSITNYADVDSYFGSVGFGRLFGKNNRMSFGGGLYYGYYLFAFSRGIDFDYDGVWDDLDSGSIVTNTVGFEFIYQAELPLVRNKRLCLKSDFVYRVPINQFIARIGLTFGV